MASIPLMYAQEDCELGGKESIEDDFAYRNNVANADKEIRLAFVRKSIWTALSATSGYCCYRQCLLTCQTSSRFSYMKSQWMVLLSFILSMVTLFALIAKRRDSPANLYLLAAFTAIQAYTVGVVVSYCDTFVVLQALGLTFAVVFGLTLYTSEHQNGISLSSAMA
ncbi:hypothetical protein ACJJTC_000024 [Scirpophaga incertulas]